jgi:hypothetical protein
MKKTLATLAVGATVAIGAVASPTAADARWHHRGFPVAPIVGGLAAGAILGAALAPRVYYSYGYQPVVYVGPSCYVRRERIWDGWRWRIRRVEECY